MVVNSTLITATTAAHAAGAVSVVVTNTDGQSGTLTNGYTYTNSAPAVISIAPGSGSTSGGTSVTITGTGFLTGATVKLRRYSREQRGGSEQHFDYSDFLGACGRSCQRRGHQHRWPERYLDQRLYLH